MITGYIDENFEARTKLRVVHQGVTRDVDFLLDTGFNGYLAIDGSLVKQLGLQPGAVQRGITADGRMGFFDTVEVELIWHEQSLLLLAQILDEPLIGTRLLAGNELFADWSVGGEVRVVSKE